MYIYVFTNTKELLKWYPFGIRIGLFTNWGVFTFWTNRRLSKAEINVLEWRMNLNSTSFRRGNSWYWLFFFGHFRTANKVETLVLLIQGPGIVPEKPQLLLKNCLIKHWTNTQTYICKRKRWIKSIRKSLWLKFLPEPIT